MRENKMRAKVTGYAYIDIPEKLQDEELYGKI